MKRPVARKMDSGSIEKIVSRVETDEKRSDVSPLILFALVSANDFARLRVNPVLNSYCCFEASRWVWSRMVCSRERVL